MEGATPGLRYGLDVLFRKGIVPNRKLTCMNQGMLILKQNHKELLLRV